MEGEVNDGEVYAETDRRNGIKEVEYVAVNHCFTTGTASSSMIMMMMMDTVS